MNVRIKNTKSIETVAAVVVRCLLAEGPQMINSLEIYKRNSKPTSKIRASGYSLTVGLGSLLCADEEFW